jgi:hypothetical protein
MRTGLYEHLVTERMSEELAATVPDVVQLGTLEPADAHEALARHIAVLAPRSASVMRNRRIRAKAAAHAVTSPLLAPEARNYGFMRNTWALKPPGCSWR